MATARVGRRTRSRPSTRPAKTRTTPSTCSSRSSGCSPSSRPCAAYSYKKSIGQPFLYPDNSLDLIENFLRMMFAVPSEPYEVSPTIVHALKQLLILHADHEQNCSTSTVRLVGSSDANIYASIAAGVDALWGPLHGGANQAAIEMLEMIRDNGGDVQRGGRAGQGPQRRLPPLGLRPPRVQELRPAGPHPPGHRRAGARRAQLEGLAVRHRARARAGRAHRRLLHRAQAVPQRRLLLRPHLPGDGLPHQHVPGAVRDRPPARMARALEGRRTRTRRTRSAGRARSTPGRPSASTSPSTSVDVEAIVSTTRGRRMGFVVWAVLFAAIMVVEALGPDPARSPVADVERHLPGRDASGVEPLAAVRAVALGRMALLHPGLDLLPARPRCAGSLGTRSAAGRRFTQIVQQVIVPHRRVLRACSSRRS